MHKKPLKIEKKLHKIAKMHKIAPKNCHKSRPKLSGGKGFNHKRGDDKWPKQRVEECVCTCITVSVIIKWTNIDHCLQFWTNYTEVFSSAYFAPASLSYIVDVYMIEWFTSGLNNNVVMIDWN